MIKYDAIVFIGRVQPCHLSHIEIIKRALKQTDKLLLLCGSANGPRTIKNPWTFEEREQMVLDSIPEHVRDSVQVIPLNDKMYNDQQWVTQVQTLVSDAVGDTSNVALIGHFKDKSSYYLDMFPQWNLIQIDSIKDINATDIRQAYFSMVDEDDFDTEIGHNLPPAIHDFLKAFRMTSEYDDLVEEFKFIEKYKSAWDAAPYPPTFVTVDAVVIQSGHVLLVRRRASPGRGLFAIPGGFLDIGERVVDGAIRELREETKIKVPAPVLRGSIKSKEVFDHPDRSLRGRTITHACLIELPAGELPKVKGSDDADKAVWVPLSVFEKMQNQMFDDHFHIVQHFIGEL